MRRPVIDFSSKLPILTRLASVAALAAVLAAGGPRWGISSAADGSELPRRDSVTLTLLHVNDHHSHLVERAYALNLTNAAGATEAVTLPGAGFARVVTAFRELSAGRDNVIRIHAGDALTGSLYFNHAGEAGEADAAMMNRVCFDSFTLGNHEFDKGDTALANFIRRLHADPCGTPVISANVVFGAESALNPARAPGDVQPYTIVERGGQRIGIVGITIAGKTRNSSNPDPGTAFLDETETAQRAIDELRAQGVNKIVLATHVGRALDREMIARLRGVGVVIGGDSHTLMGPPAMDAAGVGSPAAPYPERLTNADGNPVCMGQAWEYGKVVGEMTVTFDADGVVTACSGTPHVLVSDTFDAAVPEADRAAYRAAIARHDFLRVTAPDAATLEALKPFQARVRDFEHTVVAVAGEELCMRRVPGGTGSGDYARSSAACNARGEVSARGGDIQQLVAQANLDIANRFHGGADISLVTGGGVREPLSGRITAADMLAALPFDDILDRLEITGAEAMSMIEDGLDATFRVPGGTTGAYPYTGGMRFDVDASQPRGSRAGNFEVFDRATGHWEPLDPARTYRLFVRQFHAAGGDGYHTLARVPQERREDIGVLDAHAFQAYIDIVEERDAGLPVLRKLDSALYSTKSFVAPATL